MSQNQKQKRGHGEGTWKELKDKGLLRFQFSVTLPDGTVKRPAVYGKTKEECRNKAANKREELEKGIGLEKDLAKATVEEWLNRWLNDYVKPRLKESTYLHYSYIAKKYLIPELGKNQIKSLRGSTVQYFIKKQVEKGLAPRYIHLMYSVIHSALDQAVDDKLIAGNVSDSCKLPTIRKKEMQTLSVEQAGTLLKAVEKHRLKAAFYMLLGLPLRIGELLGLRWKNVDLNEGSITINETVSAPRNKLVIGTPKNETSIRTLMLPAVLIKELKSHKVRQAAEKLEAGDLWTKEDWVFCNEIGQVINPKAFHKSFKKVLTNAGLPSIRVHDTRHTAVTMLLERGIDIKTVQTVCGHADIKTTLQIYAHTTKEQLAKVANVMDEVIKEGKATKKKKASSKTQ